MLERDDDDDRLAGHFPPKQNVVQAPSPGVFVVTECSDDQRTLSFKEKIMALSFFFVSRIFLSVEERVVVSPLFFFDASRRQVWRMWKERSAIDMLKMQRCALL